MNRQTKQQGFTIIEVVLVLAIAALIFLMVFIALPALQKSQRDTARKNDASIVASAVTKYTTSERKSITSSTSASDLQAYVDDLDQYKTTNVTIKTSGDPGKEDLFVYPSSQCDGSGVKEGTSRQAAVRIRLESGSGNTFYCVNAS